MTSGILQVAKEGAVDWVTLNRPERLNALNPALVDELLDYFHNLQFDHSVRVVVLQGAGRAFCAGLDLKENANRNASAGPTVGGAAEGMRAQRRIAEIVMRMRRAPQPVISLVQGAASGGGFCWRSPPTCASPARARA